jgi:hypothetical protein
MHRYYFDTETYPIRPGLMAPKLVCEQFAYDGADPSIRLDDESFYNAVCKPDVLLEAHNGAFDYAVLAAHDESNLQPIFRALANGRGRDTQIRETLKAIRLGDLDVKRNRRGSFSLGTLAKNYCGMELDKGADSWRTRYALLDGVPLDDWPEEARRYALEDVIALRAVSEAQRAEGGEPPDEWFQVAAAFSLHLAAAWGVVIDQDRLQWVEVALLTRKEAAEQLLDRAGFFRDGSVNKKAVQAAVVAACERFGQPVPRTEPTALQLKKHAVAPGTPAPEGSIRTNADTIEALAEAAKRAPPGQSTPEQDEAVAGLVALVEHGHATKMHSTYIAPMRDAGRGAMGSRPNVLVASGRTSWGGSALTETNPWWPEGTEGREVKVGTNLQNFPREDGVRDCIMARPGCWLSSTDYSALELRTFAQCCLWIVGYSTFADGFKKDPDWDPHCYFAGHLTGKSYEEAIRLHKSKDKDFALVRQIAKNLNFSLIGGVGAKKFQIMARMADLDLTLDQCYFYKDEWLKAFPETAGFFQYISWLTNNNRPYKQFVTNRLRGDVGFTDGCNTGFQGLGGDISKYAMFLVSMASYAEPKSPLFRSRPLVLVHDEILAEHPVEVAHEANAEVVRLMVKAFEEFCPDIPGRAEPTLMTHWIKGAKPRFEGGRLVAWDL